MLHIYYMQYSYLAMPKIINPKQNKVISPEYDILPLIIRK